MASQGQTGPDEAPQDGVSSAGSHISIGSLKVTAGTTKKTRAGRLLTHETGKNTVTQMEPLQRVSRNEYLCTLHKQIGEHFGMFTISVFQDF